jgi:phytoene dehydrogenase-like protein
LEHYLTADRTKIFEAMPVTESGPVNLDAPFTAFNLVVMSAGSVLDGYWGFVKGGLWRLPLALDKINRELGVDTLLSTDVRRVSGGKVTFTHDGKVRSLEAEAVFLATEPLTAARLTGDSELERGVKGKRLRGSSGKVVMVFSEPVRWKGDTGHPEFAATVRYLYEADTWGAFAASNTRVRGEIDYSPCMYQVYVEGGAMRQMGWDEPSDYLSIFCKDFGLTRRGAELPEVKAAIESRILSRIENPESLVGSVLFTPRDSFLRVAPDKNVSGVRGRTRGGRHQPGGFTILRTAKRFKHL